MWYIRTMDYHSATKKNGIIPLATTWVGLENVKMSEVYQRKTNMVSLICRIKK